MKNSENQPKTLLFIGAHPDDETFGPGGTLALYAARGVHVYHACATRGEAGTASPEHLEGYASMGEMRWAELERAAATLGLAGVIHLGFRDSGMQGAADNRHPQALINIPAPQAEETVVRVLRSLKPQVVITHDERGGYGHPDHVALHQAVIRAFQSAADPGQFPQAGTPHRAQKLYYPVFSRRALRITVRLMKLLGKDPHRYGRNRDIDLAGLVEHEPPVHAVIGLDRQAIRARNDATACYRSQLPGRRRGVMRLADRLFGGKDLFTRGEPAPSAGNIEKDLFEGIVFETGA
jgi:N-acetyl-1-D-myo-inositol-2-amino-2-deoxy-alpha-D-glucopyranoside deacetylase